MGVGDCRGGCTRFVRTRTCPIDRRERGKDARLEPISLLLLFLCDDRDRISEFAVARSCERRVGLRFYAALGDSTSAFDGGDFRRVKIPV